jgi:cytochrome c oxidase cbb3-type subunit III
MQTERNASLAASTLFSLVLALALAFPLAGCGPTQPAGSATSGAPPAESSPEGEALYAKYCALCHGDQGEGYRADNATALANQEFLRTATDPFLWTAIDRGRPGTPMSAFGEAEGGPLGADEIRLLVSHMRSFQTEPSIDLPEDPVKGDQEAAKSVYKDRCSGCHGREGEGRSAVSLNNPIFLATASDAFIRHAIESGRPNTTMPAFGSTLEASAIDDLTALIRSWARTAPDAKGGEIPPTFEQVVIQPDGPAPSFSPLREGRYVPADELHAALQAKSKIILLDARPTSDWIKSHIPGALPVPFYDAEKMIASLPKDGTWIVAYCGCPHAASGKVMDALRAAGFPNTAVLDEGIFVWMKRGYPTTTGAEK